MSVITKFTGFLLACFLLIGAQTTFAEELWPESFDVSIDPGDAGSFDLILVNDHDSEQVYTIDLLQVEISDEHEELGFFHLSEDQSSWISLDDDVLSLAANTQGSVGLTIAPPETQDASMHTIGVQVTRQNQETLGIGVQTAIVSLGFISVGELEESYQWLDVSVEHSAWQLPVESTIRVRNEGERVVIPQGTMRVTSLLGREVANMSINSEGSRVLEDQTRSFTTYWGEEASSQQPLAVGIFTIDLEVQPWEDGEVFYARQHIILFPWRGAVIALALIGLLAWLQKFLRGS